jgi:hypothetical protein
MPCDPIVVGFLIRGGFPFSFLMDALVLVVTRVHCNRYSNVPEGLEPVFMLFLMVTNEDLKMAIVKKDRLPASAF